MSIKKQNQSIYFFGDGKADGNTSMRDLLGGKGAGLAEMSNAGVPVPPGITISTEVCNAFFQKILVAWPYVSLVLFGSSSITRTAY